jgi:hypothetical protein
VLLIQWFQSMAIGILVGIGIGYLAWKLPVHVAQFQAWRDRRLNYRARHLRPRDAAFVARIRGAYSDDVVVPNTGPEMYAGERLLSLLAERWQRFVAETAPRSPLEYARRTDA